MSKTTVSILIAAHITVMTGCSTASKDIASTYVSPLQYQAYDCDQLAAEAQRVHGRTHQLGSRLDEASSNDKVLTGVGLVLFWPALFALGGTKEQEAEYARLKGEYDAVQHAAVLRKCPGLLPGSTVTVEASVAPGQANGALEQVAIVPDETTATPHPAAVTPDQGQ